MATTMTVIFVAMTQLHQTVTSDHERPDQDHFDYSGDSDSTDAQKPLPGNIIHFDTAEAETDLAALAGSN